MTDFDEKAEHNTELTPARMNSTSSRPNQTHHLGNPDGTLPIRPYLLPKESPLHVPPHVVLAEVEDDIKVLKKHIIEVYISCWLHINLKCVVAAQKEL